MLQELPLIFVGGLLGSAHCVGMCGGLALSMGTASIGWKRNLSRQLVFSFGRIATYSTMGAIAGFVGARLNASLAALLPVQTILALVAGALLVLQGLHATGMWRRGISTGQHPCLLPRFLSTFLSSPGWGNAMMAGVFTGFLPCGLVYAFLALAAATQSMFAGWGLMIAFGLGTVPLMVTTGLGGSLLSLAARHKTLKVAGCCVILAGVLSILRGVGVLESITVANTQRRDSTQSSSVNLTPAILCPLCRE